MTLTISSDFKTITIGSSDILDLFAATPANYQEINISVYINCCTTEYALTIEAADLTVGNEYIIDNTFFDFSDEVLPDGVYQVSIEAIPVAGDNTQETQCTFVDQYLGCQVASAVSANCNTDTHILYYMLKRAEECNCYCSDMCLFYDRILSQIDENAVVTCAGTTSTCNEC